MSISRDSARLPRPSNLGSITDRQFFGCLMKHGPMSRAAIAEATGISKPTISESAQRLLRQSLVVETDRKTEGHQGRSGLLYDINAVRGHCLGVALESGRVALRALNLRKEPVWEWHEAMAPECTGQDLVGRINEAVAVCRQQTGTELLAIGFSVAAPVDPVNGEVVPLPHAPFPPGHDIHFFSDFAVNGSHPIVVDNDVNWATLAESAVGVMQGVDDFLYVYLGAGIGAGLFLSGRLHRGVQGLAGEIGYIEDESGRNLLNRVAADEQSRNAETSLSPTRAESLFGGEVLTHQAGRILHDVAQAITVSSTILNPGSVVLGGPYSQFRALFDRLKSQVEGHSLRPIKVAKSRMPDTAPLIGAADGAHELALVRLGMLERDEATALATCSHPL